MVARKTMPSKRRTLAGKNVLAGSAVGTAKQINVVAKEDDHYAWNQVMCCDESRLGRVGTIGHLGKFKVQGLNKKR